MYEILRNKSHVPGRRGGGGGGAVLDVKTFSPPPLFYGGPSNYINRSSLFFFSFLHIFIVSPDFSDLPDMTDEYIDLSV